MSPATCLRLLLPLLGLSGLGCGPAGMPPPESRRSAHLLDTERRIEVGLLTEPSAAPPAEIAHGILRAIPAGELPAVRVQPANGGTLVRLRPVSSGIEVVGADASVRLDRRGRIRWVSSRPFVLPPDFDPIPHLSAAEALGRVTNDDLDPARHARLVIYAGPAVSQPRLAYQLRIGRELPPRSLRIYLDARDGSLLSIEDLTRRGPGHTARIFPVNPVESDDQTELTVFADLPDDTIFLSDPDVEMRNCIDQRRCHPVRTTSGTRGVHYCELVPRAAINADGNFLDHRRPQHDSNPEDTFAEVQAYHHIKTAYASFRGFAQDPDFRLSNKLTTIVNMRVPDLTSPLSFCQGDQAPAGSRLQIEENSYFWPADGLGPTGIGDRVVLHQAHLTDWAYDGELVYHEFTHAVLYTTTPLAWRSHDRIGTDTSGGGLHEGFADYFAATITGNPELCWYAGTTGDGPAPMSTLDNHTKCTEVLSGEEHEEGEAWSGALWAIRRSLRSQSKRDMLDRALFTVISSLDEFDGFPQATALVMAELALGAEELIEEQDLDREEAGKLRDLVASAADRFAERGLPDCNGRILPIEPGEEKAYLQLLGPNTFGIQAFARQLIPATMQFELHVPADTPAIAVVAASSFALDDSLKRCALKEDPELKVLIKAGVEPIAWTWDLPAGTHDADRVDPIAVRDDGSVWGQIEGPFPAGVYHLQLANLGADWGLENLRLLIADLDGRFDDKQDSADPPGGAYTGSGCATAGLSPLTGLCACLLALFVLRWRRSTPP